MKNNINKFFFKKMLFAASAIVFLMLFSVSCSKDFLDIAPDDELSPNTFYQTESDAIAGAFSVYERLSDSNNPLMRYLLNGRNIWSDDAWGTSWSGGQYLPIGQGTHSPSFGMVKQMWGFYYNMIRRANVFLENVDNAEMDEALRTRLKAEVRYLRAWAHQELTFLYGDVPLVTKVLAPEEASTIGRTPKADVLSFLVSELTEVAGTLPASYSGSDVGRATKGAANALLSRIQLREGNFAEAATAAQSVMSGPHELETNFGDIFKLNNENNEEVIFDIQFLTSGWDYLNVQYVYTRPPGLGGWTGSSPSQSLVDEFEMANGLAITDVASGYDANDPFANRDPRLGASIIFPGEVIDGKTLDPWDNTSANRIGGGNSTTTGYWQKKFYDPAVPSNADGTNTILIRYAEVLLNFAEATNEVSGSTAAVYDAVNSIRSRAGMPDLPAGLSKEQMRDRILHERRVELAFEGDRFYTINRRKLAEVVMPQDLKGAVDPTTGTNVTASTGRVFDSSKQYLWPVPQSVIDFSDQGVVTQNPNW